MFEYKYSTVLLSQNMHQFKHQLHKFNQVKTLLMGANEHSLTAIITMKLTFWRDFTTGLSRETKK